MVSQQPLVGWLPNTQGRHPGRAKGPSIIFGCTTQHLLGNQVCARVPPLPWPTETTFVVVAGHRNGVTQAFTLEKIYRGKGLCVVGVYLML